MKQLSLEEFFKVEQQAGQCQDNQDYKRLHYHLGKVIHERLNPKSILEIGPGPGAFLEYFVRHTDVQALGVDLNPYSRDYFLERNPGSENNYTLKALLEFPIRTPGDVLVSTEVMEHIDQRTLDVVIPKLAKNYKWFWFSSTPKKTTPEQDIAWGHINVKYDHEWVMLMERNGWAFDSWVWTPTEWSMLFRSTLNM